MGDAMDPQRTKGTILLAINIIIVGLIGFAVMKGPIGKPMMGSPPEAGAEAGGDAKARATNASGKGDSQPAEAKKGKEKKVSQAAPAEAGAVAASGSAALADQSDGDDDARHTTSAQNEIAVDPALDGAALLPLDSAGSAPERAAAHERNNAGVREFNAGNYEAAMDDFEAALREAPEDSVVRRNLAIALAQSAVADARDGADDAGSRVQRARSAIARVERAITLDPKNASLLRLAGELHMQAGNVTRARHALQDAEDLAPKDATIQRLLGELAYGEEKIDEAVKRWERAIALGDADPRLAQRLEKARREEGIEGEMDLLRDRHFVVKFADGETGAAGEAELALRALEEIRDRIGRELSWYPARPLAVILYSGEEFREVTGAHGWMGGLFDGKIRIPIRGVHRIDDRVEKLLTHEYAHALFAETAPRGAPGWLDEGFAQWIAGEWSEARARALVARLNGAPLVPFKALEGSFTAVSDGALAEQAYFQAFLAVDYLTDRYRTDQLKTFLKRLAAGEDAEEALEGVYRLDYEELTDSVADRLAEKYATRP
jgi:Flp pilus assembly protein TadD